MRRPRECLQYEHPGLSWPGFCDPCQRIRLLAATKARSAPSSPLPPLAAASEPAPSPAPAKPTLGVLLRALRQRNSWTLKEMSTRTGIPFSTLSKVENDRLTLTYDKLQQLAERLGLRMSELFAEPDATENPPSVMGRRSIATVDSAIRVTTPNYDYYYLCTELRKKRMVPILTRIRARSVKEFGRLVRHSGEEWMYVLEGRVEVHTEFYDSVCLEAGQAIYIDSNMGHAYVVGEGCDEALIIGSCSCADEDQMSELMSAHAEDEIEPPLTAGPAATAAASPAASGRRRP